MFKYNKLTVFFLLSLVVLVHEVNAQGSGNNNNNSLSVYRVQTESAKEVDETRVKAAELYPTNVEVNFKAGEALLKTVNKGRAAKYFLRVLDNDPDYKFNTMFLIGLSYQYGLEFDKALVYFMAYRRKLFEKGGNKAVGSEEMIEVNRKIYECENAKEFTANPKDYQIINIGPSINTEWEEYAPVLNADETQLVFTARKIHDNTNKNLGDDNKPYEDIYIAEKINGHWTKAKNIGSVINTSFNDSNLALSADGSQLFIYKDANNGDIYVSELRKDGTWTNPSPLGSNINSSFSENSVSLSPDGFTLFFSSDRPGGEGDERNLDIYYSMKYANGQWGKAVNLGNTINTGADDNAPFLDYDGKTLYFSSKGREGMGGFDIYKSVYDSATEKWGAPKNLGYPINTPGDDIHFVSTKDGKRGYYASAKASGYGRADIYMVTIDETVSKERYKDKDKDGLFDYEDKCPELYGTPENNGCPALGDTDQAVVSTAFSSLEFETGSSVIKNRSYQSLDGLARLLGSKKDWKLLVEGHTDNVGKPDDNLSLSEKRAQTVVDYLTSRGVAKDRFLVYGYGQEKPIMDNDSSYGRQKNRRVEMTVLTSGK